MDFVIVGDLHGHIPSVKCRKGDVLCTGDVCSSALRPWIFKALKAHTKHAGLQWWDYIGVAKAKQMVRQSWQDGRNILEAFNRLDKQTFIVPGNWDWMPNGLPWKYRTFSQLIKGLRNVKNVHFKKVRCGDYDIIGYGNHSGPELPVTNKDKKRARAKGLMTQLRYEYNTVCARLNKLFRKATRPVIFITHNVPYNTSLDKVLYKKSTKYGEHVGSVVVREMIKKHKPAVCVGGHIHSPFKKTKVNGVYCVNAGYRAVAGMSLPGPVFKVFNKGQY